MINLIRTACMAVIMIAMTYQLYSQNTLIGKVEDETGTPMVGASILETGTSNGTITDIDGMFSLDLRSLPSSVTIQFLGFATQNIDINELSGSLEIVMIEGSNRLNEIVVTGLRGKPRTILDSPVPIDNINAAELRLSGQRTVDQMINFKVPSYNSTQQTISDATAHFDPSELRNLGPSRTLVLINGKRKNQSAQVYVNETPGRGEVGVDMKSIPVSAIKRIEVLRDGASAQYGSDAIAGVINIVLKDRIDDNVVNFEAGQTTAGDGFQFGADFHQGFRIGNRGYINFTGEAYHQDYTNRAGEPGGDGLFGFLYDVGAIPIEAALGFEASPGNVATGLQIRNGDTDWQRQNPDLGMIVGQPEYDKYAIFANFGLPSDNGEFYMNGGYTYRDGKSFALYRVPYWPGIPGSPFVNPLGGNPYQGFHPTFESFIDDVTFTIGNRWDGPWTIDISMTTGSNSVDYLVRNSINPSLGLASPTEFDPGGYTFGHIVGNLDFARSFGDADLSFGAEIRRENFEVRAGQEESYIDGGVQSFPGLQPENALDEDRGNVGLYAGLDYDVSNDFLVGAAVRFEDYSDFGGNFSWKLNARQKLGGDKGAVRASVSTGFRAPSLHQIYLSNIQTLVVGGNIAQEGTFNNVSPVTRELLGVPQLDAETSLNITAGLTYRLSDYITASVDYYNVQVDDRILFSNQIGTTALPDGNAVRTQLLNSGVESFKFFVNALDTRTSGVDVVLNFDNINVGESGRLGLVLALNANSTDIEGEINAPAVFQENNIEIFNREEEARVTSARPDLKVSFGANLNVGEFQASLNNTYFGKVTWQHPANPGFDQTFSAKVLTDLILGYNLSDQTRINLTVNNLFDVYPDEINPFDDFETNLGGRFRYPWEVNQFGFLGAIVKFGISFKI